MKAAVWYMLMKIYYKFSEDGTTEKETSVNRFLFKALSWVSPFKFFPNFVISLSLMHPQLKRKMLITLSQNTLYPNFSPCSPISRM